MGGTLSSTNALREINTALVAPPTTNIALVPLTLPFIGILEALRHALGVQDSA